MGSLCSKIQPEGDAKHNVRAYTYKSTSTKTTTMSGDQECDRVAARRLMEAHDSEISMRNPRLESQSWRGIEDAINSGFQGIDDYLDTKYVCIGGLGL